MRSGLKLIAIGSNLPDKQGRTPLEIVVCALKPLEKQDIRIAARSRWYRTAPVPASDQPDFINGIISVETNLDPVRLLARMHEVEAMFGRVRSVPNAARVLDLDLIDYDGLVRPGPEAPILPHPRMTERAFVLVPMLDVAPDWRHPVSGAPLKDLIEALPPGQRCEPIGC